MRLAAFTLLLTLGLIALGGWQIEHYQFSHALQWWAMAIVVMVAFLKVTSRHRKQRLIKRCQHNR